MARIRSIKPGFFLNEDLASLPFQWRLLFVGLWTQADREGRLEDRPLRLKASLFPYDDLNIDDGLGCLANAGLIIRYERDTQKLIAIPTWTRHQMPHRMEPPSELLGPNGERDELGHAPNEKRRHAIYERDRHRCLYCDRNLKNDVRARCVDHVIPIARGGSHNDLNLVTACKPCNAKKNDKTPAEAGLRWPDGYGECLDDQGVDGTVNGQRTSVPLGREGKGVDPDQGRSTSAGALRARFERFWVEYPKKVGKDAAWKEWLKRSPNDALTDQMIDVVRSQVASEQWLKDGGQFIPHPRTWLHQGRWQDEVESPSPDARQSAPDYIEDVGYCFHSPKCTESDVCRAKRAAERTAS